MVQNDRELEESRGGKAISGKDRETVPDRRKNSVEDDAVGRAEADGEMSSGWKGV